MVEYIVAGAIVMALLAIPIGGSPSAIELFMRSIRIAFARFLGAISLPM